MRVVTYDFTVHRDDIGELERRIVVHLGDIASDIDQVGIVDADDEGDIS